MPTGKMIGMLKGFVGKSRRNGDGGGPGLNARSGKSDRGKSAPSAKERSSEKLPFKKGEMKHGNVVGHGASPLNNDNVGHQMLQKLGMFEKLQNIYWIK